MSSKILWEIIWDWFYARRNWGKALEKADWTRALKSGQDFSGQKEFSGQRRRAWMYGHLDMHRCIEYIQKLHSLEAWTLKAKCTF